MLITHEQLRCINAVQSNILAAVAKACRKLDIPFYMVHGSLLGTIRNGSFVPDDDDIDIAIFRKDYERFVAEGSQYMEKKYFIQTSETDTGYPLDFAKVRDSDSTYIIDGTQHCNINHGIFIDVFPIDYSLPAGLKRRIYNIEYKFLSVRLTSVYHYTNETISRKIVRLCSCILLPDYKKALKKRSELICSINESEFVKLTGGKSTEQCIPFKWFAITKEAMFEGVKVYIPVCFDEYLTMIYGDYKARTLIEGKISTKDEIEVNACLVDVEKPFSYYIKGDQQWKNGNSSIQ